MRSPARILFVLFTLLLTVQGEPVLGARTKVIVRPAAGRSVPEEAYGICLPVRLSCDGVAVCGYDAQLPTGERVAALSADELAARGVPPMLRRAGHSLRPMHRAVAAHWPKSHCGRPMEPGSGRGMSG